MDNLKKIKGLHLKRIRKYCGMTQAEFGEILGAWGITSRVGIPGKDEKIIASWESGRRDIPDKVLRAIKENVLYEGFPIRWEYLIGQDDFITIMECVPQTKEEMIAIINHSSDILAKLDGSLFDSSKMEFIIAAKELLKSSTFSGFDLAQIQESIHFWDFLEAEIKRSIESYMKYFNQRKED